MNIGVLPCAFHSEQYITNFCRAEKCLLPMCPKCIKLHAQEHREAGSYAAFQSIGIVTKQIEQNCQNIERMMERCQQQLVQIKTEKKSIQNNIKQKLCQARNRILKQFERQLIQVENQVIRNIFHFDQVLVLQFKNVQQLIDNRILKVQNIIKDLSSQKCLKSVINFFSSNFIGESERQFAQIQSKLNKLLSTNIELVVDDSQILQIRECLKHYMQMAGANINEFFKRKGESTRRKFSRQIQHRQQQQS